MLPKREEGYELYAGKSDKDKAKPLDANRQCHHQLETNAERVRATVRIIVYTIIVFISFMYSQS